RTTSAVRSRASRASWPSDRNGRLCWISSCKRLGVSITALKYSGEQLTCQAFGFVASLGPGNGVTASKRPRRLKKRCRFLESENCERKTKFLEAKPISLHPFGKRRSSVRLWERNRDFKLG